MRDYADLKRRGVKFEGEPKVMPYGTGVMMQDPTATRSTSTRIPPEGRRLGGDNPRHRRDGKIRSF
jgi:hypothetical protein